MVSEEVRIFLVIIICAVSVMSNEISILTLTNKSSNDNSQIAKNDSMDYEQLGNTNADAENIPDKIKVNHEVADIDLLSPLFLTCKNYFVKQKLEESAKYNAASSKEELWSPEVDPKVLMVLNNNVSDKIDGKNSENFEYNVSTKNNTLFLCKILYQLYLKEMKQIKESNSANEIMLNSPIVSKFITRNKHIYKILNVSSIPNIHNLLNFDSSNLIIVNNKKIKNLPSFEYPGVEHKNNVYYTLCKSSTLREFNTICVNFPYFPKTQFFNNGISVQKVLHNDLYKNQKQFYFFKNLFSAYAKNANYNTPIKNVVQPEKIFYLNEHNQDKSSFTPINNQIGESSNLFPKSSLFQNLSEMLVNKKQKEFISTSNKQDKFSLSRNQVVLPISNKDSNYNTSNTIYLRHPLLTEDYLKELSNFNKPALNKDVKSPSIVFIDDSRFNNDKPEANNINNKIIINITEFSKPVKLANTNDHSHLHNKETFNFNQIYETPDSILLPTFPNINDLNPNTHTLKDSKLTSKSILFKESPQLLSFHKTQKGTQQSPESNLSANDHSNSNTYWSNISLNLEQKTGKSNYFQPNILFLKDDNDNNTIKTYPSIAPIFSIKETTNNNLITKPFLVTQYSQYFPIHDKVFNISTGTSLFQKFITFLQTYDNNNNNVTNSQRNVLFDDQSNKNISFQKPKVFLDFDEKNNDREPFKGNISIKNVFPLNLDTKTTQLDSKKDNSNIDMLKNNYVTKNVLHFWTKLIPNFQKALESHGAKLSYDQVNVLNSNIHHYYLNNSKQVSSQSLKPLELFRKVKDNNNIFNNYFANYNLAKVTHAQNKFMVESPSMFDGNINLKDINFEINGNITHIHVPPINKDIVPCYFGLTSSGKFYQVTQHSIKNKTNKNELKINDQFTCNNSVIYYISNIVADDEYSNDNYNFPKIMNPNNVSNVLTNNINLVSYNAPINKRKLKYVIQNIVSSFTKPENLKFHDNISRSNKSINLIMVDNNQVLNSSDIDEIHKYTLNELLKKTDVEKSLLFNDEKKVSINNNKKIFKPFILDSQNLINNLGSISLNINHDVKSTNVATTGIPTIKNEFDYAVSSEKSKLFGTIITAHNVVNRITLPSNQNANLNSGLNNNSYIEYSIKFINGGSGIHDMLKDPLQYNKSKIINIPFSLNDFTNSYDNIYTKNNKPDNQKTTDEWTLPLSNNKMTDITSLPKKSFTYSHRNKFYHSKQTRRQNIDRTNIYNPNFIKSNAKTFPLKTGNKNINSNNQNKNYEEKTSNESDMSTNYNTEANSKIDQYYDTSLTSNEEKSDDVDSSINN